MQSAGPGYNALRRGRYSNSGTDYFLTLNLQRPAMGLEDPSVLRAIRSELMRLETEGRWTVRTATVMPDHLHLLIQLGMEGTLSSAVRLLKGRLASELRRIGVRWQPGYYDRHLRPDDDRLPVFLYVFLNPYRAGLLKPGDEWTGFSCRPEDWEWFRKLTDADCPFPEWLK